MCEYKYTTYGYRPEFKNWWNEKKNVAQCKFIAGVPEEGAIDHQQRIVRVSNKPYTFRYRHPTDTITGIACTPVDEETQSPEAEVIDGGVNFNHVTMRLTPVEEGKWACDVAFFTKPSPATRTKKVTARQLSGLRNVLM